MSAIKDRSLSTATSLFSKQHKTALSALLTCAVDLPHNRHVTRVKSVIGRRKPVYIGAYSRLMENRLSGIFVRANHFFMGEACGHLYGGRFLCSGISYPAMPRSPSVGRWREAPSKNLHRSTAMTSHLGARVCASIPCVFSSVEG